MTRIEIIPTWRDGRKVIPAFVTLDSRKFLLIDPEDREQVALILSQYHSWKWNAEIAEASITDMQAALRLLLTPAEPPKPVKPPEPMGLGAVVEDDLGEKWVRLSHGLWSAPLMFDRRYVDLTAVRVLSEGVL